MILIFIQGDNHIDGLEQDCYLQRIIDDLALDWSISSVLDGITIV